MKIQIWGFWHASKSQYMLSWAEALDVTFAFINRRVSYNGFLWLHGILFCLLKLLVCKLVLWEIVCLLPRAWNAWLNWWFQSVVIKSLSYALASAAAEATLAKERTWTMAKRILQTHTKRQQKKNCPVASWINGLTGGDSAGKVLFLGLDEKISCYVAQPWSGFIALFFLC